MSLPLHPAALLTINLQPLNPPTILSLLKGHGFLPSLTAKEYSWETTTAWLYKEELPYPRRAWHLGAWIGALSSPLMEKVQKKDRKNLKPGVCQRTGIIIARIEAASQLPPGLEAASLDFL